MRSVHFCAEVHHYHHQVPCGMKQANPCFVQPIAGLPSEVTYPIYGPESNGELSQPVVIQPEAVYPVLPNPVYPELTPGTNQGGCPNQPIIPQPKPEYLTPPSSVYPELTPGANQGGCPNQPIVPQPQPEPDYPGTNPNYPSIPEVNQPPVTSGMTLIEQQIFELVNQERANQGLAPLGSNEALISVARRKSKNMGDLDYFSHTTPDGKTTLDWLMESGWSYHSWGENIANFGANATAQEIMTGWMNSPGHRANILANNFTLLGVGVYQTNGRTYATQVFGSLD